jgi:hypothetical protein
MLEFVTGALVKLLNRFNRRGTTIGDAPPPPSSEDPRNWPMLICMEAGPPARKRPVPREGSLYLMLLRDQFR